MGASFEWPWTECGRRIGELSSACLLLLLSSCGSDSSAKEPTDGGLGSTVDAHVDAQVDAGTSDPLTVTTTKGPVHGKMVGTTRSFLGIPYAKAPVGPLRFMPPQPPDAWSDARDATNFGPSCPQPAGVLSAPGAQSEDCLSLNVFSPTSTTKLPVMVWIYGGAFVSGGSVQYPGERFASEGPVVLVTLNYRVGVMGFFSHPTLDATRNGVPSGNDTLRDQQLALQWVHDNIEAFGGDVSQITLFGESSGSMSTCLQMVSPTAQNLANRYILESASCAGGLPIVHKEDADRLGTEFANAFCSGEADLLACLRSKDANEMVNWGSTRGISGAGWAPAINPADPLLPEHPVQLIQEGKTKASPLLIGTNRNEWSLFLALAGTQINTVADLSTAIDGQFPEAQRAAIKQHYAATDATAKDTFVRLMTDSNFRCPARTLARLYAGLDRPVYLYSFEEGKAFHAYEIPYLFGNPSAPLGIVDVDQLHAILEQYWTQYARAGDPNVASLPTWPRYDRTTEPYLTLGSMPSASQGLSHDDCTFWDTLLGSP